ncbi:hypothetical protein [Candidatus Poriferisocius sp.]|uniref:hypothetical protein n=1 Tax=Candidatus Poriferisocius sp. TaxID=3101276 RepID=UPI003B0109C3
MGAERLHLGRLFQRARHTAIPKRRAQSLSAQESAEHPPQVIKQIQEAELETAKRIAEGTADADAKDRSELAEYFNKKLGRQEFTA